MPDTTPSSSPIWTLTQVGFLEGMVALHEQKFGANAPSTLAVRKELEEARKLEAEPQEPKAQRYWGGLR